MVKKDFSDIAYILGIMSIVLAFFLSLAGLIIGVVGYKHSIKQKTGLSEKAKKLNIIGIVISIIFLVTYLIFIIYSELNGVSLIDFPV